MTDGIQVGGTVRERDWNITLSSWGFSPSNLHALGRSRGATPVVGSCHPGFKGYQAYLRFCRADAPHAAGVRGISTDPAISKSRLEPETLREQFVDRKSCHCQTSRLKLLLEINT